MINLVKKFFFSMRVQIALIIVMVITVVFLFYYPNTFFKSSDPKPDFYTIMPSDKSEKRVRMVKTGLFLKNFPEFSIVENEFVVDAILWFEFNPHKVSLETIEKFSFEKGKILKKSKVKTKIIGDKLWAYYKIKLEFKTNLDYRLFPLEDHRLFIRLINTEMQPSDIVLVSYNSDFLIREKIFTKNWKIIDKNVEFGYLKYQLDNYEKAKSTEVPLVLFSLDFEKVGMKKSLIILLPLFIVFILSLISLLMNVNNFAAILSLSVGSMSALVMDLFVIEKMSPNVRYFTISDKIYTLLLLSALAILMINLYVFKQVSRKNENNFVLKNRAYIFLFFVIFITLTTYMIIY